MVGTGTLTYPQIEENKQAKRMWEIPIQTVFTVLHKRPGLIYVNIINNNTFLIDMAVPSDFDISAKEIGKLLPIYKL